MKYNPTRSIPPYTRGPTRRPGSPVAQRHSRPQPVKYLLAGGSMLALVGVLIDFRTVFQPTVPPDVCQQVVQSGAVLSRDQLSRLLSVPERDSKTAVRAIVNEPYCTLANVEIRAGVEAEREAYPLQFDPQTWFVILYEGEEYAGYAFSFQR